MKERTKVVELSGSRYQLRRLPPEVGSFIFMRMLGVSMRAAATAADEPQKKPQEPKETAPPAEKPNGEMQVRALSFSVFSGGMDFKDFRFIQNACLQVVSVIEERQGNEFPMPLMSDAGVWTPKGEDVSSDVGLVMRLTTEVLIFCFADFFDGNSPIL